MPVRRRWWVNVRVARDGTLIILPTCKGGFRTLVGRAVLPITVSHLHNRLAVPGLVAIGGTSRSGGINRVVHIGGPIRFSGTSRRNASNSITASLGISGIRLHLSHRICGRFGVSSHRFANVRPNMVPSTLTTTISILTHAIGRTVFSVFGRMPCFSNGLASRGTHSGGSLVTTHGSLGGHGILNSGGLILASSARTSLLNIFASCDRRPTRGRNVVNHEFKFSVCDSIRTPARFTNATSRDGTVGLTITNDINSSVLILDNTNTGTAFGGNSVVAITNSRRIFTITGSVTTSTSNTITIAIATPIARTVTIGASLTIVNSRRVSLTFDGSTFLVTFHRLRAPTGTPNMAVTSVASPRANVALHLLS